MSEIGIYDAKTHFPKLVARAQRGERITITRHGKAVAELRPVETKAEPATTKALFARMDAFRAAHGRRPNPITVTEIVAAKNEGRR